MRALVKSAPGAGHIAVQTVPVPTPAAGEALVRIRSSGLCGTDLLLRDGVYRGRRRPVPSPLIVGHEAAGEVAALGPGTTAPAVGTRVAIESLAGCGVCYHCQRGAYNLCQDWHHLGLTRDGLLAEFAVASATSLMPLPDGVTDDQAAFLEPLATAVHALERCHALPSQSAAIVGPGPLGLLHLLVFRASGLRSIVVYGQAGDDARLVVAASLGADVHMGDRDSCAAHAFQYTSGLGYSIAVEAGGTSTAIQTALDIVGGDGTLVSLGIVPQTTLDVLQVMRKDLTWIGVVASVRRHYAEAIALIRSGMIGPERIITHRLPLEEALAGLDALRSRAAVKVMFRGRA